MQSGKTAASRSNSIENEAKSRIARKANPPSTEHRPAAVAPTALLDALGPIARKRHSGTDVSLEEPVHRKATGAAPTTTNVVLGQGRALEGAVQRDMESRFGARFDDVRIHDDTAAGQAATALNAEAFTRGHDVAFAPGKYAPSTREGRELLAHELTHVLQNRSGHTASARVSSPGDPAEREADATAARIATGASANGIRSAPTAAIHRAKSGGEIKKEKTKKAPPSPLVERVEKSDGKGRPRLVFKELAVDKYLGEKIVGAYDKHLPVGRAAGFNRDKKNDPEQQRVWRTSLKKSVTSQLMTMAANVPETDKQKRGDRYAFQHKSTNVYYFGTISEIAEQVSVPKWNRKGDPHEFEIDHIVELQLAHWPLAESKWAGAHDNLWLYDAKANTTSGARIKTAIRDHVASEVDEKEGSGSVPQLLENYDVRFERVRAGTAPFVSAHFFEHEEISDAEKAGKHSLGHLRPADSPGAPTEIRLFCKQFGGVAVTLHAKGAPEGALTSNVDPGANVNCLAPLVFKGARVDTSKSTGELGTMTVTGPKEHPALHAAPGEVTMPLRRITGYRSMGVVDQRQILDAMKKLGLRNASPLVPGDVDFGAHGLYSRGKLVTDLPVWKGADIDYVIDGSEVRIEKQFEIGDIKVPKPFRVSGATMTLSVGTHGVHAQGDANFAIDKVGQGGVTAAIGSTTGLELGGHFALDKALFAGEAKIAAHYARGAWSVEGDLSIPAGKIPGVKSGTVHVGYADEKLTATGAAELSIPGVKKADLGLELSEKEGLTLAGRVDLADGLPGIKRGFLGVRVHRPASGGYQLSARGEAEAGVAGVGGKLAITYEDGAFDAFVQSAFEKGRLRGFIGVGVTNRVIDKDGKPVPGKPTEKLSAYGGGSLNVRFSKWLEGTVGAKIGQQGDLELSGRVALPASIPVFEPYVLQKEFGHLGVTVPIFGPIVAGVSGGFTARATVGPGTLEDAHLDVTYNPAHEEQAKIGGGARFHVPAFVGVGFFVRGGIGLSVLVAKVQGFVEANAEFGLAGAADASVAVSWSPSTGVALDAAASIKAEAALKAGLALGYEASALLWSHTKSYQLKSYDLGTRLSFGVHFPIQYRDGKPFAIALDAVRIDYPDIKPTEIIPKLVKAARGGSEEV